jgi:hypothetical protein
LGPILSFPTSCYNEEFAEFCGHFLGSLWGVTYMCIILAVTQSVQALAVVLVIRHIHLNFMKEDQGRV